MDQSQTVGCFPPAAAATFASASFNAHAQTPAVTFTDFLTGSDSNPYTLGWAFSLSNTITVTHLGVWGEGSPGDYLAGLWKTDGTLLTSTTVLGTDPTSDRYRWGSIASLVLGPGSYVVAAEYRGGLAPVDATGVNRISGLAWTADRQAYGAGLQFPTLEEGGDYGDNGILWANFATDGGVSTVPEPSTYALMFAGLVAVGVARRRSGKGRTTLA